MSGAGAVERWGDAEVARGQRATVHLVASRSYFGNEVRMPLHVWRGAADGPTVMITGAVHGDEINGTGAIRQLISEPDFELGAGTLVLVPVVNVLGFERHSRYLPDRRDLNRCFPGSADGSLASRLAGALYEGVVRRCDYGIDLHTAALRRTNFPNVRADMSDPRVAELARSFGAELIVSARGPEGSLRRTACADGCPTMLLEAGEVWKVEPAVVEYTVRGIRSCLAWLGMVDGAPQEPPFRVETDATRWVRAEFGGFLTFHVAPGSIVAKGDAIATNTSLFGEEQNVITAPRDGIVLGMTTLPVVAPGDAVCHLAFSRRGELRHVERAMRALDQDDLHGRMRDDLARSIRVQERDGNERPSA